MPTAPVSLFELERRRRARVGFGATLALLPFLLTTAFGTEGLYPLFARSVVFALVPATWLAAALVWAVLRFSRPRQATPGSPLSTPAAATSERPANGPSARLALWSVRAPLIGLSLALPLTLHWPFFVVAPDRFASWVMLSLVIVGHAHLVVAGLAFWLSRAIVEDPGGARAWASSGIVVVAATATAAVPGLAIVLPPMLTLVTAVFIFPALYTWARDTVVDERKWVEAAQLPARPLRR